MIERLTTITELTVESIQVSGRLRDVSPDGVASLVEAIGGKGFFGRILVRRTKKGDFVIDGAHRLTAARELGMKDIPCDVVRCSEADARMLEIDGNLAGSDLTVLDTAVFLAERKRAYEKLHPETKRGVAGASVRWDATDIVSFASATAEKFGISERQVQRIVAAGEALTKDQLRWLRAAPKAASLADLTALAKTGDEGARSKACIAFTNGDAKSIKEALSKGSEKPVKAPVEEHYLRLRQAFERAPKPSRKRFVRQHLSDLTLLIREIGEQGGEA